MERILGAAGVATSYSDGAVTGLLFFMSAIFDYSSRGFGADKSSTGSIRLAEISAYQRSDCPVEDGIHQRNHKPHTKCSNGMGLDIDEQQRQE